MARRSISERPDPVNRPCHHDIEAPPVRVLEHLIERRALVAAFAATDPEILINLGDGPTTTLGDLFQPRSVIHPVPMNVVALNNDVAQIDADPEYDPLVFRGREVALGHPALHRDGAGDRLNDARELDQKAIAGRFDDAAPVVGDFGID